MNKYKKGERVSWHNIDVIIEDVDVQDDEYLISPDPFPNQWVSELSLRPIKKSWDKGLDAVEDLLSTMKIKIDDDKSKENDILLYCICADPKLVESDISVHGPVEDKFWFCRECKKERI